MLMQIKNVICGFFAICCAVVSACEAYAHLPGGAVSPLQVPLLTTPAVVNSSRGRVADALQQKLTARERRNLVQMGRKRLMQEPLDPKAIWLTSLGERPLNARRILNVAAKVSRRDRIVQIELMRINALMGNLPESLKHLDILLTVSPAARVEILQGIARGLEEPGLLTLLSKYASRPWFGVLLQQAVLIGPRSKPSAQLLLNNNLMIDQLPRGLLMSAISRLVKEGEFSLANDVVIQYLKFDSSLPAQFSPDARNTAFEGGDLSWILADGVDMAAELYQDQIQIEIEAGRAGTAMSRITTLEPTRYIFEIAGENEGQIQARLGLACWDGSRFVGFQFWDLSFREQTTRIGFEVPLPDECVAQKWELYLSNLDSSRSSVLVLDHLGIH